MNAGHTHATEGDSGRSGPDARRLVVADASPLIGLAAARVFEVLRELFGTVVVSRAVVDEVTAGGERPGAEELTAAMREGWIRVAPTPAETWVQPEIDVGEASTIALALAHDGPALVLIDDALGRAHAEACGLELMDSARLLLAAKRAGVVAAIAPVLERLHRKGFTLPDEAVRAALAEAGEAPPR